MKRKSFFMMAVTVIAIIAIIFGCEKPSALMPDPELKAAKMPVTGNCKDYVVSLDVQSVGNNTEFVWTITNPNPGNGKGTTLQNLSHWDFVADACGVTGLGIDDNWNEVLSAWYDQGTGWQQILPLPQIEPDPSIRDCSTDNVVKFDIGTVGATPTKYKLVLNGHWGQALTKGWFKSGINTWCCQKEIPGIGCRLDQEYCSYSQGYFFASPHLWPEPGTVEIGGYTYTEAEGRAIWNASNAGGIPDSKKGFCQLAALKLSGGVPPEMVPYADIIELWLSAQGKLSSTNLPDQVFNPGDFTSEELKVKYAAGQISDWINANHCADDDSN